MSGDPLVSGAAARLRCVPVPTPFAVGRVNCWLIEDDPLTLVDTGPNSGTSLVTLEAGLREHGRSVEELERIVLTHQHMDHIGLAQILADRSGAEICALDVLVPWLADYAGSMELDDRFSESVMRRHGVPPELRLALRSISGSFRAWGAGAVVSAPLADGGTLGFAGGEYRVHHRPGHSPSDTILVHEDGSHTIGGDHLIGHISSNPLVSRPLDAPRDADADAIARPPALRIYLDSMRATAELELGTVMPGHGDPVTEARALIAERTSEHGRRKEKILALLAGGGPDTAFGLAQQIWGNVAVTQAYLTLSEVLGHLDLLEDDRAVVAGRPGEDGAVRFTATA